MAWTKYLVTYADGTTATVGAASEAAARQKALYLRLDQKFTLAPLPAPQTVGG